MKAIRFFSGEDIPLERHKVRIVQKLELLPVEERQQKIFEAKNNLYLLKNRDVFLDMLTDSGVNAMSDRQLSAMIDADDAYAGSETYVELEAKVKELFGMDHFLPAHQGRGCEKILADLLVRPGDLLPMNYHFTTTKAHITRCGGEVLELLAEGGEICQSDDPFKGNMNVAALRDLLADKSRRIPFVRMEAGANLIGGQPFSLANLRETADVCRAHDVLLVLDASLLQDNLYFIKVRETSCRDTSIRELTRAIADCCDIIYMSFRKLGFAKGGGIVMRDNPLVGRLKELVVLNEGFLTYGGMSVREMAAVTVGLEETMDETVIAQGPEFIRYMTGELVRRGIPVVTPAGGLGCHLNAGQFLPDIPGEAYPAGALAAALYIAGGIRGMERGTMSEQRNTDGSEHISPLELLRLAVPRRVFTLSQIKYCIDRVHWLWENRSLIEGLRFTREPEILRFFVGELEPVSDWQDKLAARFRADFGDSL
ncbi:MAG TPA: tryptophanase [Clostridiaceae bacterium]|jgi:tryptophanase|nr:tryptophanase [Clostridiaceae bacterium]